MKFQIINETDGILASPGSFSSREAAERKAAELRRRFEAQGYYLTTEGKRIAPCDVKLTIQSADGQ